MPPVGRDWTREQMDSLNAYLEERFGNTEAETPAVPDWQRGKVASWLVTTDHKRIGILYIATSGVFFVFAGLLAILIRTQLARPGAVAAHG